MVEVPIVVLTRKLSILTHFKKIPIITFSAKAPRSGAGDGGGGEGGVRAVAARAAAVARAAEVRAVARGAEAMEAVARAAARAAARVAVRADLFHNRNRRLRDLARATSSQEGCHVLVADLFDG